MWMFGEMCVFQTAASWGQGWTTVSYFYLFMLNLPSLECQLLESRDMSLFCTMVNSQDLLLGLETVGT